MTTPLAIALVLVVVGWFAAGTIWNLRQGNAVLRWMQGGLPQFGERTTFRWLGTTAIEMVLRAAKPPFTEVTLIVFMEPRDLPWLWAFGRLRGRRDTLIIRAKLRQVPALDLEAIEPGSWSGRDARRHLGGVSWGTAQRDGTLSVYVHGDGERARALLGLCQEAGLTVRRFSVRRSEPHFQLHVALPHRVAGAPEFFDAVRRIGDAASQGA
jgi:hypothetical protein